MHDNPADAQQSLQGLFNIAVTPFEVNGDINYDALSVNIERVIDLDFDGVLVGGQYGEFAAMTPDERAELFRRAMDIVGDRVPVLLGAPSSNPRVVAELSELAGNLGGIPMITAPYVSAQGVAFGTARLTHRGDPARLAAQGGMQHDAITNTNVRHVASGLRHPAYQLVSQDKWQGSHRGEIRTVFSANGAEI